MKLFSRKEDFYLWIREGKRGLETFISEDISYIQDRYKNQLIAFFEDAIKSLKKEMPEPPVFKK